MKIYIAASWKHQAAVEMLTELLRVRDHTVISFVEDGLKRNFNAIPFEEWMKTEDSVQAFEHDSAGAMFCDCFIYIGPSGKDAAAECGMAYAKGVLMIALYGKGEDFGITRKMFADRWCFRYSEVLELVDQYHLVLNYNSKK